MTRVPAGRPSGGGHGRGQQGGGGDGHRLATLTDEANGGGDLRAHASRRELTVGEVALGVVDAQLMEVTLPGRAVVELDRRHVGHQREGVDAQRGGQALGGEVLVDHRIDAHVPIAGSSSRARRRRRRR